MFTSLGRSRTAGCRYFSNVVQHSKSTAGWAETQQFREICEIVVHSEWRHRLVAGCATLRAGLGSAPRGGCDPSGRRLVAAPAGSQSEPDPGAAGVLLKATINELLEATLTESRAPSQLCSTPALAGRGSTAPWPGSSERTSPVKFILVSRLSGRRFHGRPRLAV